jgi:hypothetical protein
VTESDGVPALLADLAASGISLRLEGEALRFTAPAGAMTAELRARLQAAKPALIAHLRHAATRQPASLTQRRFWRLQQLDPDWPFYNVAFLFRLTGPLDPARLQRAADAVVARHDSLRTTLHDEDGRLMQHIAQEGGADLVVRDMVGADEAAIRTTLQTELLRRYNLAHDRILRLMLVRIAAETWMLQICLHNVVFDMASLLVILDELSHHYADPATPLPAPVQYDAFVAWQTARAATGMDQRRDYWRRFLAEGEPKPWSWPAITSPGGSGFRAVPTWTRLSPARHLRLQEFCRAHGVTPAIAVLTAYFQAVSRFTGCQDLVIGTTWSDRDDQRFAGMIGASIGVPAIRVDQSDAPPIATLLRRVREAVAGAVTHQDLPIEEVIPRDSSGPLFRMVFTNFPSTPHGRLRLPGLRVAWEEEELNPISRPQLYLVMWETPLPGGMGLTCHMMHREDVWDAELAGQMMQHFEAALAGLVP